jgi:electron transfer flavoprotein beta subunit
VGLILAELLGIPSVSLARSVKIKEDQVLVEKTVPEGYEVVEAKLPALVTVSNEVGELRYVARSKMLGLLKRPMAIPKWNSKDLIGGAETLRKIQMVELSPPPNMGRACTIIEGASPQEKADKLAVIFKELR